MSIHHLFPYNPSTTDYRLFARRSESINDVDLAISGCSVRERTNSGYCTTRIFTLDSPVRDAFFARFDSLPSECLCVQLDEKLVVFHDGDTFGISFPCAISSCFSCGRCVVLMKDNGPSTEWSAMAQLPVFFSLFHPLEEIRPISFDNFTDLKDGYLTSDFFTSPSLSILSHCQGFVLTFDSMTRLYSLWKIRPQRQTQYLESTVLTGGNMTTLLEVSNPDDNDMITSDLFFSSVWCGGLEEPFRASNRHTLLAANDHFYFAVQTSSRFTLFNLQESVARDLKATYSTASLSSTLLDLPYYSPIWIILSPSHEFVFYTFSDRPPHCPSLFSPLRSFQTPIKPNASFTVQSPLDAEDGALLSPQSDLSRFLSPLKSYPPIAPSTKRAIAVSNPVENRFNIEFDDDTVERVEFFLTPCNAIISDCLLVLHDYLPLSCAYSIRLSFLNYLSQLSKVNEWWVWEYFVLTLFGIESKFTVPSSPWESLNGSCPLPVPSDASEYRQSCSSIWMGLHALWESKRIESIDCHCLLILLYKISWGCRIVPYIEFYERRIEESLDLASQYSPNHIHVDPPFLSPPDILTTIESHLLHYHSLLPYPSPPESHVLSGLNHALCLLPLISPPSPSLVLQYLSDQNVTRSTIVSWVSILSLPVLSVLRSIQYEPIVGPSSYYDLIDRRDLKQNMPSEEDQWRRVDPREASLPSQPVSDSDSEGVVTAHEFSKSIFPDDCRLEEAGKALLTSVPIVMSLQLENVSEDHRLDHYERSIAKMCSITMSRVFGRAILTFRTTAPNLSSPFPIPSVPMSGSVSETGESIRYQESDLYQRDSRYYQGVASGLRLQVSSGSIPRSWILYNKQTHEGNEHAGFLLGLGLRSQLNCLSRTDIFEYLSQEDPLLTSSLLIGLSASNKRSGKQMVARMLYLHIPTLSDKSDSSIDIDINIRISAILGLGLLFLGSCHRFLVEFLLNELPSNPKPDQPCPTQSYSFVCGVSLGLICLGAAADPERFQKIVDLNIESRCSHWMSGYQKPKNGLCFYCPPGVSDAFRTIPGSLIALSFIYFDSYNPSVLSILPFSNPYQTRPDIYLLSVVCRSLVGFSNVCMTTEWVESQYPLVLRSGLSELNDSGHVRDCSSLSTLYLAYTTCGVCLSLGLKYLATSEESVVRFIREQLRWLLSLQRRNFEFLVSLSLVSLSLVLLGTGSLSFLSLLSTIPETTSFASQMARSMSIGFLFLGAGSCSVDRTAETVAFFFLSVYPLFPGSLMDKAFSPISVRFLWALAAQPQLLRARDVEDHEDVQVPFQLKMKDADPYFGCELSIVTPSLLPSLSSIQSISVVVLSVFNALLQVRSPRYFPFVIEDNLTSILSRSFALFVKRRRDCLPYEQDPMGLKSLNKCALSECSVPLVFRDAPESFRSLYSQLHLNNLTDCLPAVLNLYHFHHAMRVCPSLMLSSCTRVLLHLHTLFPSQLTLLPLSFVRGIDAECLEFFTQLGFFRISETSPLFLYYQTHAVPDKLEAYTSNSRVAVADVSRFRLLFKSFLNFYNFPSPYLLDIRQIDTLTLQLESYPSIRLLFI